MHQLMHVGVRLTKYFSLFAILRNSHFIWQADNFNNFFLQFRPLRIRCLHAIHRSAHEIENPRRVFAPNIILSFHRKSKMKLFLPQMYSRCLSLPLSPSFYPLFMSSSANSARTRTQMCSGKKSLENEIPYTYSSNCTRRTCAEDNLKHQKLMVNTYAGIHINFHSKTAFSAILSEKNSFIFSISTDEREKISKKIE